MLEGEMAGIIKSFQDAIIHAGGMHTIMDKVHVVIQKIAGFFSDLPNNLAKLMRGAAHFLDIAAAVQAIIGGILLALAPITGGATIGAGAAMLLGAAKTEGLAIGTRVAAGAVEDFMKPTTVGGAAAANQVAMAPAGTPVAAAPSVAAVSQPQTIVVHNITTFEGEVIGRGSQKYSQAAAPMDNTTGQYQMPHNNSAPVK